MKSFLLFFCLYYPVVAFMQTHDLQVFDKINHEKIEQLRNLHDTLYTSANWLINGTKYTYQYPPANGHPFFAEKNWIEGKIITHQNAVEKIKLRYDIFNDALLHLYFSKTGNHIINLNPLYIKEFDLNEHRFIYVKQNDKKVIRGFYEILHEGDISCLVKWKKYLKDQSGLASANYVSESKYYLKKGEKMIRLIRRKNLLDMTGEHAEKMKKYLRQNFIFVRVATEQEILGVFKYYESIK